MQICREQIHYGLQHRKHRQLHRLQAHIWRTAICPISGLHRTSLASTAYNSTRTTFDGGAYRGFFGGRETGNAADAAFMGLYADPSGNTGILIGSFSGAVSGTTITMNGGLFPVKLGTTSVNPADFYNSITDIRILSQRIELCQ